MSTFSFPAITISEIKPTLDTLHIYSRLVGKIRQNIVPEQKHWYHASIYTSATGLTTRPIWYKNKVFDVTLDLTEHNLIISTNQGYQCHRPLIGQSPVKFYSETMTALRALGIEPEIDQSLFSDTEAGIYRKSHVEVYWRALSQIDAIFERFKGELRQETSPVQLWPHHFDLALLWFSGRLVPGQDPTNAEYADEQMNFGFAPGDDGIPEPYFYITAYPLPDALADISLPKGASWHKGSFTGAIMPYSTLVNSDDPAKILLTFLRSVQQAGANLMK
jgi:hypothetical protein